MSALDLPDWWTNQSTTSAHPVPGQLHTAVIAGAAGAQQLIGVPPAGQFIRLWAVSAGVLLTAGISGYIDAPVGNEHIICQVGESLNLSFYPVGLSVPGTNMVVNTVGSIIYSITAVYDFTP